MRVKRTIENKVPSCVQQAYGDTSAAPSSHLVAAITLNYERMRVWPCMQVCNYTFTFCMTMGLSQKIGFGLFNFFKFLLVFLM